MLDLKSIAAVSMGIALCMRQSRRGMLRQSNYCFYVVHQSPPRTMTIKHHFNAAMRRKLQKYCESMQSNPSLKRTGFQPAAYLKR